MKKNGYTIGWYLPHKKTWTDFFVVSDAKRRTKKDAAKIATAAGIEPSLVNITFIKKVMEPGTVDTYFSKTWNKTMVKINTAYSGLTGFLEDSDVIIIK